MRRLLQSVPWPVLLAAYLAFTLLEWLMKACEWLMLSDMERWDREDEKARKKYG